MILASPQPVRHYPMAVESLLVRRLEATETEKQWTDTVASINDLLQNPVFAYRPLPQAKRFHQSEAQFRWCLGGNRSSKSHSLAMEVYWYATGTHPWKTIDIPNTGWYCTLTWELVGTILWEEKLQRLLQNTPHNVVWRNRGRNIPAAVMVKTPKGWSKIVFKAYEQGRRIFQGVERRYIANDEQFPQDIYTEQISRIGEGRLDFFCAMTPIEPQPWLETRLTTQIPANWEIFEYPLDDNRESRGGFLRDAEIDTLIEEWPEEIQPTRRQGKWASYLGAVYKTFSRAVHMVPEREENKFFPGGRIFPDRKCVGGIDWGGNNPFVFLWAIRIPHMENEWYIFDEYYWDYRAKGNRLIREHANMIKSRTLKWRTHLGRVWSDHDRQDRMEIAACGVPTLAAKKEPVLTGIECIQTHLKVASRTSRPRLHIAERCVKTLVQMATYRWPEGTDTRNPADAPVPHEDHCPDVVRYIVYSESISVPSGKSIKVPDTQRIFA